MRRFILEEGPDGNGLVRFRGKDYRYLVKVLRLGVGDRFRAELPGGGEVLLSLRSIEAGHAEAELVETRAEGSTGDCETGGTGLGAAPPRSAPPSAAADRLRMAETGRVPLLVLCQALPKGQKMDLVVRQAAEAGVARLIPFVSRYSVPRFDSQADAERRRERWERIVREGRQQSGSLVPTLVEGPTDLDGVLRAWEELRREKRAAALLLHQDPLAQGTLHGYLSGGPEAVMLAIGPEGGFSEEEAQRFMDAGFSPVVLGANVLRTETAALFAVAAINVILLESASWMPIHPLPPRSNE